MVSSILVKNSDVLQPELSVIIQLLTPLLPCIVYCLMCKLFESEIQEYTFEWTLAGSQKHVLIWQT